VAVNPADTSQDCSQCGRRKTNLTLADRMYICSCCGVVLDRDLNASLNIMRVGQHALASAEKLPDLSGRVVTFLTLRRSGSFDSYHPHRPAERIPFIANVWACSAPVAVLAHSSVAGLFPPPESSLGARLLAAANRLRQQANLSALARLNDGWAGLTTLVTTISELDPAAKAGERLRYVGPIFERFPEVNRDSPWMPDDDRPLVLVSFTTTGI
jgi:hypothetical protein